ncbi:hypothetical protein HETIRDRAFT_478113 [Heterobasidion irregulare TC 32-1]|uniref:Methyltransferase type 12 domain-containing protein n=1 Tax=Heterobasidion irregulare (strain TC 32-1) TaxID=747525 RepID=W4K159_HETIT|nr:uncharacterized protein HETIRDRAFT_478113 [Heterobasidion irregulare TC 32-1]ETW78806.1 hypothetical protein HETIRDRAFT_478113 [Heterobasidion irregulare TC 32-1]
MHLKSASSVRDPAARAPPFGSRSVPPVSLSLSLCRRHPPPARRLLTDDADVWSQNAWDHVPPPDDQDHLVAASLARQRAAPVPDHDQQKYNATPARHWDNFYQMNAANFFKNRKWLPLEFPELVAAAQPSAGPQTVVEIGCGAGNSIFPLLAQNTNPHLSIHAYDYSSHAVKLVQNNPLYAAPPCGSIHAAVWDLASSPAADGDGDGGDSDSALPPGLAPASADLLVLVFVLSALHPHEWPRALANIHQARPLRILKPGGRVLLRDYGRHDLTQLRFRAGRLLADNFYIRGDKTRVYFFELDELALLFTGARAPAQTTTAEHVVEDDSADADAGEGEGGGEGEGEGEGAAASASHTPDPDPDPSASASASATPEPSSSTLHPAPAPAPAPAIHPSLLPAPLRLPHCPPHPLFAAAQLGVDRRLLLNRKRQLKMYRVWMQAQFVKL